MTKYFSVTLSVTALALSIQAADPSGFEKVMVPFFDNYCMDCHDDEVRKGLLTLESLNPNVISDDFEIWRMIDEQIRFGEMPPKDKKQPNVDEKKIVLEWLQREVLKTQYPGAITIEKLMLPQYGNYVDHQMLFGKRLPRVYPAPPRIWRLRPDIYKSVMPPADGLSSGLAMLDGSEFKDYASSYFIDEASASPLIGNAKKIAAAMMAPKSKFRGLQKLAGKKPPTDEAVQQEFKSVFQVILGRAPTQDEQSRFFSFYQRANEKADHQIAVQAMITAILIKPEVLYRLELGQGEVDEHGRTRLSPREIVFALSYAINNRPLDTFKKAAISGGLDTKEKIAELVRKELADDSRLQNKHPRIFQFFREYFDYPFAIEVFKDPPEGGTHEASRLVSDLQLTIMDVLNEDKDVLGQFLTTNKFYVYTKLGDSREGYPLEKAHVNRSYYHTAFNLPIDWAWDGDKQPIEFRSDERAGILTHPAWLAAWSGNFENHPVQRGKWIRTHLLGGTIPDVPIGVDARVPEKEHTSFRERLRLATSAAECWRCHRKMDPLGVAFERYDHYGRYQRLDAGQPVDASSRIDRTGIPELDGKEFNNPTDMVRFLAKQKHVEQVFVRYAFRYFLGRNETLGDANTLQDAHKAYVDSGGSFRELVVSLLSSDSFLYREKPQTLASN